MKQTFRISGLRLILPTLAGLAGAAVAMFFNEVFVAFCAGGGL